jgi:hypothetical protein
MTRGLWQHNRRTSTTTSDSEYVTTKGAQAEWCDDQSNPP